MKSSLDLLRESPFFESFSSDDLEQLAAQARLETIAEGTVFVRAGEPADTLYMVVVGSVELFFPVSPSASDSNNGTERLVFVRTISEPGRPIGWSAMVEPYVYRASAVAKENTQVLAFDRDWLEEYARTTPSFGVTLMEQILWVLGNRLRETRVRLVAQRYERETMAIRAALGQHAEQLPVTSPLHKIPFYLENRLTFSDAFHTLDLLRVHGDELERNLAGLCLDILEKAHDELDIYQRLQAIYEYVANSPPTVSPSEIRRRCCEEFRELFENVDYVIDGLENLPGESGNIVVMNHLANHPENTLPNEFVLTLDTHFVSCMILQPRYESTPIRVIRKSNRHEFGHQAYYDRLGYIYVYAGHVDPDEDNPEFLAEQRRRDFYDAAKAYLLQGKNILICPEGTSTSTERSPLPFRAGAFRLATLVQPEPRIVPVAVANFDKKITRTTVAAVVGEPFRLSDLLHDPGDKATLLGFVREYQRSYIPFVQRAIALAASREAEHAAVGGSAAPVSRD